MEINAHGETATKDATAQAGKPVVAMDSEDSGTKPTSKLLEHLDTSSEGDTIEEIAKGVQRAIKESEASYQQGAASVRK